MHGLHRIRFAVAILLFGVLTGCTSSERASEATSSWQSRLAGDEADEPAASNAVVSTYVSRPAEPPREPTAEERSSHNRMRARLELLARQEVEQNHYYGRGKVAHWRRQLQSAHSKVERLRAALGLTLAELDLGNEVEALRQSKLVEELLEEIRGDAPPAAVAEIFFALAMVHFRHGETQNCCLMHNADSCLLPIRGGGVHTRQDGSRNAAQMFEKVLDSAPPGSKIHYQAQWLLNLAYMTLDEHPDAVPRQFLIDPDRFLSKQPFPRFINIARQLGLDQSSMAGSVIAEDFNNNGYIDLMVCSWDLRDQIRLYINTGNGRFVDRTREAGLVGIRGGLNLVQADYNNDGWVDVLVLRGAWLFGEGQHPNSLLRNNGDGTFTDVTIATGLAEPSYPSQTAAWADYDLDGYLDLYIGNEGSDAAPMPCQLFRNNGDGTFTDVTREAGVINGGFTKGVAWGDYNNDRYPDLYVSNLGGVNRLYRNNGDGTFTDVAQEAGVADFPATFACWFWDFDNDGILDLFVAAFDGDMEQVARYYLGHEVQSGIPRVLKGTLEGQFIDVTESLGLREPMLIMGANFGDLDNDGYLDMFLGTGDPDYRTLMPNRMYRNVRGERFEDVSVEGGFSNLQKGHGVAFADLNSNGNQDVFIQMGGAYPVDQYYDALYENPGFGNHWLAVELVGIESNSFGVGARIRADIIDGDKARSIYRWVNSGGSFGGNSFRRHIGLGKAVKVERLEIYWPRTDCTQEYHDLPVNCVLRIAEGAADIVDVTPRAFEFGIGQ